MFLLHIFLLAVGATIVAAHSCSEVMIGVETDDPINLPIVYISQEHYTEIVGDECGKQNKTWMGARAQVCDDPGATLNFDGKSISISRTLPANIPAANLTIIQYCA